LKTACQVNRVLRDSVRAEGVKKAKAIFSANAEKIHSDWKLAFFVWGYAVRYHGKSQTSVAWCLKTLFVNDPFVVLQQNLKK